MAKEKRKAVGEASQSYFGYSLQLNRMLVLLLNGAPGDVVWLEKFDDVGLTRPDGSVTIEQDATYQTSNPLTDSAEKLWKTLANWITGASLGWYLVEHVNFQFYVLQHYQLGPLAASIHEAKSIIDAESCFSEIEKKHWGTAPNYKKKGKVSGANVDNLNTVLANKALACEVIARSSIVTGNGDPESEILQLLEGNPLAKFRPVRMRHYIIQMLGWLKVETDKQLAAKSIAHIPFDLFQRQSNRYTESHLRESYLAPLAEEPEPAAAFNLLNGMPNFVRQLKLIDYETNDLLQAVNVFIRAREDFSLWCADGELTEADFDGHSQELVRQWSHVRRGCPSSFSDTDFGRAVASECFQKHIKFNNFDVPPYFTEGVYHDLANAPPEELKLGWHRRYKELLK